MLRKIVMFGLVTAALALCLEAGCGNLQQQPGELLLDWILRLQTCVDDLNKALQLVEKADASTQIGLELTRLRGRVSSIEGSLPVRFSDFSSDLDSARSRLDTLDANLKRARSRADSLQEKVRELEEKVRAWTSPRLRFNQESGVFQLLDRRERVAVALTALDRTGKIELGANGVDSLELASAQGDRSYVLAKNSYGKHLAELGGRRTRSGGSVSLRNQVGREVVYAGPEVQGNSGIIQIKNQHHGHSGLSKSEQQGLVWIGANGPGGGGVAVFRGPSGLAKDGEVRIGMNESNHASIYIDGDKVFDFAEVFDLLSRNGIRSGTVVSTTRDARLTVSREAYDRRVVGVIAGGGDYSPGIVMGRRSDGSVDLPVALAGQVYVRVNDENGTIRSGDLLVSSSVPGVAMRASDHLKAFGSVIGKALEDYQLPKKEPEGFVRMLVMNR